MTIIESRNWTMAENEARWFEILTMNEREKARRRGWTR